MTNPDCERLDDYLARALDDRAESAFIEHCASCEECRLQVEAAARLNEVLVRATRVALPIDLVQRLRARRRAVDRRRNIAKYTSIAAAIAGILTVMAWRIGQGPSPLPHTSVAKPSMPGPAQVASARVWLPPGAPYIALPQKTKDPHITIVWLYHTQPRQPTNRKPQADHSKHEGNANDS